VSGKSTLTYHLCVDPDDHAYLRVNGNTGGGFFSKEWVSLDHIKAVLDGIPAGGHPVATLDLFPLFKNRSVNTPGYLLAVLLNEGLLSPLADKKRRA
jgi:hypothetical protein